MPKTQRHSIYLFSLLAVLFFDVRPCAAQGFCPTGTPNIASVTPQCTITDPVPASVKAGDLAHDTQIRVFRELQDTQLTLPITMSANAPGLYDENSDLPSSSPVASAGQYVRSHYIHYDAVGLGTPAQTGSVTFTTPIIGIVDRDGEIEDSNELACTNTEYPNALVARGYELGQSDWFSISSDMYQVAVGPGTPGVGIDALRVLTVGFPGGEAACCVDAVYLFDSSVSMDSEITDFCSRRWFINRQAFIQGVDYRFNAYRIGGTDPMNQIACEDGSVGGAFGLSIPGSPPHSTSLDVCPTQHTEGANENWAGAIAIVAEEYPWRDGCRRLIIPVADEGAHCGDHDQNGCEPSDDLAVTNAIEYANRNYGIVSPIAGAGTASCVLSQMDAAAIDTWGIRGNAITGAFSAPHFEALAVNAVTQACTAQKLCDETVPIGDYRFDATPQPGLDSSGWGNHGNLGAASLVSGFIGQALSMSPTNNAIEFQIPSSDQNDILESVSAMAWIKPGGNHTSDSSPSNCTDGTIIGKGGNYWLQINQDNTRILIQNDESGVQFESAPITLPIGQWSHVAFVRFSYDEVYFYLNGQLIAPDPGGSLAQPVSNSSPVTIGSASSPSACEFNGQIDELRLYDCALRPDQVEAVYEGIGFAVPALGVLGGLMLVGGMLTIAITRARGGRTHSTRLRHR